MSSVRFFMVSVAVMSVMLCGSVCGSVQTANAQRVQIGRYESLYVGMSSDSPAVTVGVSPQRDRRSHYEAPRQTPSKQWEVRVNDGRAYAPLIDAQGRLWSATTNGFALVNRRGDVERAAELGFVAGVGSLSPANTLWLAGQTQLFEVDQRGVLVNEVPLGTRIRASPLVLEDSSVIVMLRDSVLRLERSGELVWRQDNIRPMYTPASMHDGRIVVASRSLVRLLDRDNGDNDSVDIQGVIAGQLLVDHDDHLWVPVRRRNHPFAYGGGAGAGAWENLVLRVQPDKTIATTVSVQTDRVRHIAVDSVGRLRVLLSTGALVCFEQGGAERWRVEGRFLGDIVVDAAGTTLALSRDGTLSAISIDGDLRWSVSLGVRTQAAPVIGADGTVYIATQSGKLHAWK